jgi:hypothetical protein
MHRGSQTSSGPQHQSRSELQKPRMAWLSSGPQLPKHRTCFSPETSPTRTRSKHMGNLHSTAQERAFNLHLGPRALHETYCVDTVPTSMPGTNQTSKPPQPNPNPRDVETHPHPNTSRNDGRRESPNPALFHSFPPAQVESKINLSAAAVASSAGKKKPNQQPTHASVITWVIGPHPSPRARNPASISRILGLHSPEDPTGQERRGWFKRKK